MPSLLVRFATDIFMWCLWLGPAKQVLELGETLEMMKIKQGTVWLLNKV